MTPDSPAAASADTTEAARRARWRLRIAIALLLVLIALALAWAWSPMRQWLTPQQLIATLHAWGDSIGPVPTALGIALALTLAVPLTPLTMVVLLAFDPVEGVLCVLAGALLAALITHGLGALLGREAVRRLGGPRVQNLSEWLGQRGLVAVLFIRFVPLAPFAIVNMVAGASHIRVRDMLLGTVLGMLPGLLVLAFFIERVQAALRDPGPITYAVLLGAVVFVGAAVWAARRWVRRRMPTDAGHI